MLRKTFAVLVPLILFAGLITSTQAQAAQPAKSKISIEVWPKKGAFGYVNSPRKACEAGRTVRVFSKKKGRLVPLGQVRSRRTSGGSIWILKNRRVSSGTVVAFARKKGNCLGARKQKRMPVTAGDYPACPTREGICFLWPIKVDDHDHYYDKECPLFRERAGRCTIGIPEGRVPWCCWATGLVRWNQVAPDTRTFEFYTEDYIDIGQPRRFGPDFKGWIVNDNSARFVANEVHLKPWLDQPNAEWYTPDNRQAAPGTPGGPLYLNWVPETDNHFHFYVHGYLYHR